MFFFGQIAKKFYLVRVSDPSKHPVRLFVADICHLIDMRHRMAKILALFFNQRNEVEADVCESAKREDFDLD